MAGLIIDITWRILISLLAVTIVGFLFSDLLLIGESRFQTFVVIFFYCYCAISLFFHSGYKLFHVLAVPILTQFIQILQKYSFPAGANSLWRLLPFIILDIYLFYFLLKKEKQLSIDHKTITLLWIVFNSFFLFISPNLANIIWGGILLYLITIPLFFVYLTITVQAANFRQELEKYLSLLYIILGFGTVGLVFAGADYKGSDNLLATRNIADTNVTMAYFILLWPFVLLHSSRNRWSFPGKAAVLILFIMVVALSFSRGAVLLVIPYILITSVLFKSFLNCKWTLGIFVLGFPYRSKVASFLEQQDLLYFWRLRFADIGTIDTILSKLESISGREEIHHIAYQLFLRRPLFGHGTGSFEIMGPGYREAHSLWFTILAEQGIVGVLLLYGLLLNQFFLLGDLAIRTERKFSVLLRGLILFFLFNHTVGSTFVILPGKSITVNCIAPILLICLYFYGVSLRNEILASKLS
ncbi:O-antigen ligase family protein [Dyadobacter psychrotolerans]|uniref:O-antigen polymerase n=1 Tax=Dyadobacter psychrotolerans TaxID=2541721 RepID=A0A4R5DI33_9BACT|nr:O-antigen ligase family protein [Dyadobacter psychrotolerans]TDE11600.1 O-antigen polymerase [Dyadobacter psychrotolerans]